MIEILKNKDIGWIIFKGSDSLSYMYSKDYTISDLRTHQNGMFENCYIAFCGDQNSDILKDSIHLYENFNNKNIIYKFRKEVKILSNSGELGLDIVFNDGNLDECVYLMNGGFFTFKERKQYKFPKGIEDFKVGMVVEYFNNNEWKQKKVLNVESEYKNMYELLIRFNKLRIES